MNIISNIADQQLGERPVECPTKPLLSNTEFMGALVWNAAKDVRYLVVPKPLITDSRDIILKVTATSICGSDIHLYDGSLPTMQSGDILGHEFMGIIDEVGPEVTKFHKGQRVIVAFGIACGKCDFCAREEYTGCKNTNPSNLVKRMYGHRPSAIFGYSHLTGGVPGGQAEYVRVPFADTNCFPIPEEIPDEKALFMTDVIPTAYHGVKIGKVKQGSVVGIWGLGPIGLMCAKWCQVMKASRIVGIDCVTERLQIARDVLGIDVIDFKNQNVCDTLEQMFPDGIDVAIECVGGEYATSLLHKVERTLSLETDTADIFSEMFHCVRPFGHVAVLGVYSGYANHFPVGTLMEKGLVISSGQAPVQKYWDHCLENIKNGNIDPTFLITHRGSLSQAPELLRLFAERKEGILKVFLRPEVEGESRE